LAEVEATLQAGLVDLAAASAVMSGHLARPMSHAGFGPLPQVQPAPQVQPVDIPAAPPDAGPAQDRLTEWSMWPMDDELRRRRERSGAAPADRPNGRDAPAATAVAQYNGKQANGGPSPAQRRPPADAVESLRRAETDLADAASAHWQREHDLAEAEAAMEAVMDRLESLDQQRMQLRREKVAAEQDLAAARAAQRAALRTVTDARRALEAAEKRLHSPIDPIDPRAHDDPE
jgi:hypothetical protein